MDSVCVSSCRCCVFVSVVHTVAIMSAVFCVICSLFLMEEFVLLKKIIQKKRHIKHE